MPPPKLTPEQLAQRLALQEQRRLKKEQKKLEKVAAEDEQSRILPREWLDLQESPSTKHAEGLTLKVMSWNVCLLSVYNIARHSLRRTFLPFLICSY